MKHLLGLLFYVIIFHFGATFEVTSDTSQAPQLASFATRVSARFRDWYPYISNLLQSPGNNPPPQVHIKFDPTYNGVASTIVTFVNPPVIRASVDHYTKNQEDYGSMIHELVHAIQSYPNCPLWVWDGIADLVRYYHYEPQYEPAKPPASKTFRDGYGVTAYFFNYIDTRYGDLWGRNMTYWINKDCREGTFNEQIFPRLTGRTGEQLWEDMQKGGPLGNAYCHAKNSGNQCWRYCKKGWTGNWCYTSSSSCDNCGDQWSCVSGVC